MNAALRKLMNIIGTPDWYHSVTTQWKNDEPSIILTTNKMIKPEIIKHCIPKDIDGVLIIIRFKNPISRFNGTDRATL